MKQKAKRIGKVLFINLAVFLAGFIIIDLVLGHYKIPYNFNLFRMKHPYYHHGMMPNASQYTAWGKYVYKFHTNSLGFRDSIVQKVPLKKKNDNHKRILIFGDSHSEGVGVKYINTFAGILQREVKTNGYNILNASAVSYSPKIHFLKADHYINHLGLEVDEVWVFIDISDLQNEIAYEGFNPREPGPLFMFKEKFKNFLERNSFTYYTLKSRIETREINEFVNKMQQFNPQNMPNIQKNTVELYEDFFSDFDNDELLRSPEFHGVGEWYYKQSTIPLAKKGLRLGQKNIARLDSLCDSNGIKLRLSVHPWHTQIKKQDTSDVYVRSWRQFCHNREIDFINLFPLFINEENPYSVLERYYIPNDNHWNEAGHERVGKYLGNLFQESY
jgi:hypothetical protein